MLTIEQARQELDNMKSHFDSGFSYTEREFLEKLNYLLFKKGISNKACQDCYRDAYILITNKLKTMEKLPDRGNYILKAGVVLHTFNSPEFYVLDVPDEVAENYLKDHPDYIIEFQKCPDDWKERILARNNAQESANDAEAVNVSTTKKKNRRKQNQ